MTRKISAAAVDSNDTKNQCTNVANSKIHGTLNNQWTAASALMVVQVVGTNGNDASPTNQTESFPLGNWVLV